MTDDQPYGHVAVAFAGIARTLFSARTVGETLQQIVDFAVLTVEGCDAAGISLLTGSRVTTPVYSHPVALEVDSVQYETAEGPCLDAITKETIVFAEDLAEDPRWPIFGPMAATLGMRSLLFCGLFADGTFGALSLHAGLRRAYGVIDRTKALIFATHAGVALGAAEAFEDAAISLNSEIHRVENLLRALASREIIGHAEGIIIERERITADQAFGVLRRASEHLNIKLREVAQYVVDTGEIPAG
jgi:GAF domain-containing protein